MQNCHLPGMLRKNTYHKCHFHCEFKAFSLCCNLWLSSISLCSVCVCMQCVCVCVCACMRVRASERARERDPEENDKHIHTHRYTNTVQHICHLTFQALITVRKHKTITFQQLIKYMCNAHIIHKLWCTTTLEIPGLRLNRINDGKTITVHTDTALYCSSSTFIQVSTAVDTPCP